MSTPSRPSTDMAQKGHHQEPLDLTVVLAAHDQGSNPNPSWLSFHLNQDVFDRLQAINRLVHDNQIHYLAFKSGGPMGDIQSSRITACGMTVANEPDCLLLNISASPSGHLHLGKIGRAHV